MLSEQRVKNYLFDWSLWVGNNKAEINKDCGYGKGPSKILIDMAKHDDPDTVYHKNRSSNLDQDAMRQIDRIIRNDLNDIQVRIVEARYHLNWKRAKILKLLHIGKDSYYALHDEAISIIGNNFNLRSTRSAVFKSFI